MKSSIARKGTRILRLEPDDVLITYALYDYPSLGSRDGSSSRPLSPWCRLRAFRGMEKDPLRFEKMIDCYRLAMPPDGNF